MSRHRTHGSAGGGAARTAGAQFLDPDVLARIDNLDLLARTVVDGFLNGIHRSPYLGLSLDFAEHRPYMPGDDIRRIDWRLYARTDRHYIKLFEAETNADLVVLLDVSRSMRYGSGSISKLDYGRYLGACLAYFSRLQRDRVGLLTFDDDVVDWVPPSARHLDLVLHALDRAGNEDSEGGGPRGAERRTGHGRSPGGAERRAGNGGPRGGPDRPGSLERPMVRAAERLRRKGILVVISDLYEEAEDVLGAVRLLAGRGHDVIVFHLLDPAELEFPFEAASDFEDMETGELMPVIPGRLREGYRALLDAHLEALRQGFPSSRIDYSLMDTSRPLDHALFRYLAAREKGRRIR